MRCHGVTLQRQRCKISLDVGCFCHYHRRAQNRSTMLRLWDFSVITSALDPETPPAAARWAFSKAYTACNTFADQCISKQALDDMQDDPEVQLHLLWDGLFRRCGASRARVREEAEAYEGETLDFRLEELGALGLSDSAVMAIKGMWSAYKEGLGIVAPTRDAVRAANKANADLEAQLASAAVEAREARAAEEDIAGAAQYALDALHALRAEAAREAERARAALLAEAERARALERENAKLAAALEDVRKMGRALADTDPALLQLEVFVTSAAVQQPARKAASADTAEFERFVEEYVKSGERAR